MAKVSAGPRHFGVSYAIANSGNLSPSGLSGERISTSGVDDVCGWARIMELDLFQLAFGARSTRYVCRGSLFILLTSSSHQVDSELHCELASQRAFDQRINSRYQPHRLMECSLLARPGRSLLSASWHQDETWGLKLTYFSTRKCTFSQQLLFLQYRMIR